MRGWTVRRGRPTTSAASSSTSSPGDFAFNWAHAEQGGAPADGRSGVGRQVSEAAVAADRRMAGRLAAAGADVDRRLGEMADR